MVWNDALKQHIPSSWGELSINEITKILSGYSFSSDTYVEDGKYKLITIKNVQDSGIDLNVDNYISSITNDIPDYCILKKGDILLSLTGNVGRIGLMYSNDCLLNQRVALIDIQNKMYKPFLYALFKSPKMRIQLERMATGTSQKNLSPIETEKLLIPGNIDIIKAFGQKTTPLVDRIIANLEENQNLKELRDWMLPMLMNGQATIKE